MKKIKLFTLLALLAYAIVGMIMTGCSEYTCPTYSKKATKSKTEIAVRTKQMATFAGTQKLR